MDDTASADVTEQVAAFMAPLPMHPAQPTRAIIEAVDWYPPAIKEAARQYLDYLRERS